MLYPFIFMLCIQLTFVLGLVWFWMENWEGSGHLPSGSWLVAAVPVLTLGVGLSLGTETMIQTGTTPIAAQIIVSIVATWLCYAVGAMVTLHEAEVRKATA